MNKSPDHPILEHPWEHSVAELRYHVGLDGSEPCLDVTLMRGEVQRRLRFLAPVNLRIGVGFPQPTHGMEILDRRGDQLEGIGVEVADFENSEGGIIFLAREVIELDAQ